MLPALPDGDAVHVGRVAERVADLERGGLLTFDAERVDRVDDRDPAPLPQLAHDAQRVVEAAADRHDLRAVDQRLRELAQRDVTVGDDDGREHPARVPRTRPRDADVFPVDAHTTTLAPSSAAFEIAIVMPRSLNEPVGFEPSTFSITRAPTASERRGASTNGVLPSHKRDDGVVSVTGKRSRYASMIPGQRAIESSFGAHPHGTHSSPPTTRSTEPMRSTTSSSRTA